MRVPAHAHILIQTRAGVLQGPAASTMRMRTAACGWSVSGRAEWSISPCSTATTVKRHTSEQTLQRTRSKVSKTITPTHLDVHVEGGGIIFKEHIWYSSPDINQHDQIMNGEIYEERRENIDAQKLFFGRTRHRWEDNIRMNLRRILVATVWTELQAVGCFEHDNETSGPIFFTNIATISF